MSHFIQLVGIALFIGIVVLIFCSCTKSSRSKRASRDDYEDPDRHPFQDIPGQAIMPGEQLYG